PLEPPTATSEGRGLGSFQGVGKGHTSAFQRHVPPEEQVKQPCAFTEGPQITLTHFNPRNYPPLDCSKPATDWLSRSMLTDAYLIRCPLGLAARDACYKLHTNDVSRHQGHVSEKVVGC
ncbi:hypothetical protein BaRGS_00014938, partial [Batillaria attramentaria]